VKYLWLLTLAACTTFDPVTRGVCGNGIVEDGEDCDSTDATCVACAVVCATAADCPNTAYTCGIDERCHAPSGTFGQPQVAGTFAANDYRITDLDHDGIGDVVGVSDSSIVVRHGATSGMLSVLDSHLTPTQTGPAAFGDLDGDSSLDLSLVTPDGVVAYTSPYGTLSPMYVTNLIADVGTSQALDIRALFTVTHDGVGGFLVDDTTGPTHGKVAYAVFDFININTPNTGLPCGQLIDQSDFSADAIEVYQVNPTLSYPQDVVVAMLTGSTANKKLCVMAVHKDNALVSSTVTDITPANAPTYTTKPVLADLSIDTDHCPSLLDVDGAPTVLKRFDGALVGGHCTLKAGGAGGGDATPALPIQTAQAKIIGRAPAVPAVLGGANDMIVASDGIYLFGGSTWTAVYSAARSWSHVAFADLDKDNQVDLVLSGQGADDLDVLYRGSILGYPTFELLSVDTAAEVDSILIDDYDGNGWLDIAFSERVADHTELDVSYGTSDRPLPPIQAGVASSLVGFAKVGFQTTIDPLDEVADMMVLTGGQQIAGLTILQGSAQRSLLPYLDPRSSTSSNFKKNTTYRGSMIGSFVPTIGGGADHPDLLAVATPNTNVIGNDARVWIASGNGTTLDDTTSDGEKLTGLNACTVSAMTTGCVEQATFFPWRASDGHDVVFALDRTKSPTASVFDPNSLTATTIAATKAPGFAPIPTGGTIHALHAADLDGDGNPEMIAAFTPSDSTSPGGVLVCHVDGSGQPSDCIDVVATAIVPLAADSSCFDAAPGHVTSRDRFSAAASSPDLIVACHDTGGVTLYRVTFANAAYTAEVLLQTTSDVTSIELGDVTGDGVDDVVALVGASGAESLAVFRQCTSRDAASCVGESK
jgi:hypothetical protein